MTIKQTGKGYYEAIIHAGKDSVTRQSICFRGLAETKEIAVARCKQLSGKRGR